MPRHTAPAWVAAHGSRVAAISLYVGGGPAAIVTVINMAAYAFVHLTYGKVEFSGAELLAPQVLAIVLLVQTSRLATMAIFVHALSGFHEARTGWTILAVLLALIVTSLAFGLLDPPGEYGGHFIIGGRLEEGGDRVWWPVYAI